MSSLLAKLQRGQQTQDRFPEPSSKCGMKLKCPLATLLNYLVAIKGRRGIAKENIPQRVERSLAGCRLAVPFESNSSGVSAVENTGELCPHALSPTLIPGGLNYFPSNYLNGISQSRQSIPPGGEARKTPEDDVAKVYCRPECIRPARPNNLCTDRVKLLISAHKQAPKKPIQVDAEGAGLSPLKPWSIHDSPCSRVEV